MKNNKTAFIIVRVTSVEKEYLIKTAKKFGLRFSKFIRIKLGLEKQ